MSERCHLVETEGGENYLGTRHNELFLNSLIWRSVELTADTQPALTFETVSLKRSFTILQKKKKKRLHQSNSCHSSSSSVCETRIYSKETNMRAWNRPLTPKPLTNDIKPHKRNRSSLEEIYSQNEFVIKPILPVKDHQRSQNAS